VAWIVEGAEGVLLAAWRCLTVRPQTVAQTPEERPVPSLTRCPVDIGIGDEPIEPVLAVGVIA
jgi:hypothetical protein